MHHASLPMQVHQRTIAQMVDTPMPQVVVQHAIARLVDVPRLQFVADYVERVQRTVLLVPHPDSYESL